MSQEVRTKNTRSLALVYLLAILVTGVAVFIRYALDPILGDFLPLVTLYGAIAFAVWLGGYGPAIVTIVLGYLACDYFFMEPRGAIGVTRVRDVVGVAAYLVTSAIIVFLGEALRRARDRARESAQTQRVLHDFLDRLQQVESIPEIEEVAIEAILAALRCDRSSILLFDSSGVMRFHCWRGLSDDYRRATEGHSPWKPDEKDPRPLPISDVRTADFDHALKTVVEREGIRALCFIPLQSNGKLVGKFMTYFNEPHIYSQHEIDLSMTIARELALGIARRRAEEALRASEVQLSTETEALVRLNRASSRLWQIGKLREGLDQILAATIELLGADKGNVQILDPKRQVLTIAVHRGFERDFLEYFGEVSTAHNSACGRALRSGERVVIEDVEADALFAPLVPVARAAGYRAVQSTPLIARTGEPLGMLSTHFRSPHRPSDQDLRRLDLYARQAADFIERCSVEGTLRTRTDELETLLELLPVPVWMASDPECREVRGNRAASEFFNVTKETNLSQTAASGAVSIKHFRDGRLLRPDELPMQRAAATGRSQIETALEVEHPDGRRLVITGGAAPLRDADGKVRGAVAAFADITDLKRSEEIVREAGRAKDEFLAMLSHELRNPLAAITNAVAILRRSERTESQSETARDIIERQTALLTRLVEDLLEMSRITRGKIGFETRLISAKEAVTLATETVRPLLEARSQNLVLSLPAAPPGIIADASRLSQAISNLLHNASKYSPRGSRIWLGLEMAETHAVIRVRDEGAGIPSEMIPRIFDPFVQGDLDMSGAIDRSRRGLGLGLTLSKIIVEHHGGAISATSAGLGKGSEFSIRLPAIAAETSDSGPVSMPEARVKPPLAPMRILIVDDSVDSANGLAAMIGLEGHEVRTSHDGESAIAAAAEFLPDVILLDIGMPGIDGYETARRLRELPSLAGTELVALTGYGQEGDRRKAVQAGFDLHVVKPIRADALLQLLRSPRTGGGNGSLARGA